MHTVVETSRFLKSAAKAGVTDAERARLVEIVAANPLGGVQLGDHLYKQRIAGRGKGKSGGYRVIVLYIIPERPVILIDLLSKGSAGNFTKNEMQEITALAKLIAAEAGAKR